MCVWHNSNTLHVIQTWFLEKVSALVFVCCTIVTDISSIATPTEQVHSVLWVITWRICCNYWKYIMLTIYSAQTQTIVLCSDAALCTFSASSHFSQAVVKPAYQVQQLLKSHQIFLRGETWWISISSSSFIGIFCKRSEMHKCLQLYTTKLLKATEPSLNKAQIYQ